MADVSHVEESQETHTGMATPVHTQQEEGFVKKTGRYLITRLPTLVPPMNKAPNPFTTLTLLNSQQWLFFAVCISPDALFVFPY